MPLRKSDTGRRLAIRPRSVPRASNRLKTLFYRVNYYSTDSNANIYGPVPQEDLKTPFETLEKLVNDRTRKLELPALLMAVNVARLQKSASEYKRYYELLLNIFDRSVASDRHFHFPHLVNECYKAAYQNKDFAVCNTLWEKCRLYLPGRSIAPEVYAMRILELFNNGKKREAVALSGDLCRRYMKTPGSLTNPQDMILERLSAVPALRYDAERILANFEHFKTPKSVSTYASLITMSDSLEDTLRLENEMKQNIMDGPRASVRLICALIRVAGNFGAKGEVDRIKDEYLPLIEKMYENQPEERQKALQDVQKTYQKQIERLK